MPIDPSIPLGVRPVQLPNPLETMQQIQQMRIQRENAALLEQERQARTAELQQNEQKVAEANRAHQSFITALQNGQNVRGASMDYATIHDPSALPLLQDHFDKMDESAAKIKQLQTDVATKTDALNNAYLDHIGTIAEDSLKYANGDPVKLQSALTIAAKHYGEQFPAEKARADQMLSGMLALPPDQLMASTTQLRNA